MIKLINAPAHTGIGIGDRDRGSGIGIGDWDRGLGSGIGIGDWGSKVRMRMCSNRGGWSQARSELDLDGATRGGGGNGEAVGGS